MAINLGIIGFGRIGKVHAATLKTSRDFKLVGTANEDYDKLLKNPDIQAISVCTPPNSHYRIALEALKAGKHVLVEKPPTLNLKDLDTLEKESKKRKLTLYTAYHATKRPEVLKAVSLLKKEKIVNIGIIYHEDIEKAVPKGHWMNNDPKIAGGGVLMDNSINALSIVKELLPSSNLEVMKDEVKLETPKGKKVEYRALVSFSFGEWGGYLFSDWTRKTVRTFEIMTTKEHYKIDLVKGTLKENGKVIFKSSPFTLEDEYRLVYKEFADFIERGKSLARKSELEFVLDSYDSQK